MEVIGALEIQKRATYHEIESLRPQEVNGVRLCLNCNKPIPEGNEKYCSRQCCVEFFAKNNQAGLRKYVFEREHGKCQKCGYQYPVFPIPFPAKPSMPIFDKPRPIETDFPNYSKTNHRIGHFKNQLIRADQELFCSCGNLIHVGDYCYCKLPMGRMILDRLHSKYLLRHGCEYNPHCWGGCQKRDPQDLSSFDRRIMIDKSKALCCEPDGIHCVACALKEIKEIEKSWNRDHRKALAAFKEAYRAWDAQYTAWAKTVMPAFREQELQYEERVKQWNHDQAKWKITAEFRDFTADHIIPIALGGPEFDLNNIQLLCRKCDKIKTANDAADIARRRREIKTLKGYAPLTGFC